MAGLGVDADAGNLGHRLAAAVVLKERGLLEPLLAYRAGGYHVIFVLEVGLGGPGGAVLGGQLAAGVEVYLGLHAVEVNVGDGAVGGESVGARSGVVLGQAVSVRAGSRAAVAQIAVGVQIEGIALLGAVYARVVAGGDNAADEVAERHGDAGYKVGVRRLARVVKGYALHLGSLLGGTGDTSIADVDSITGATITSSAVLSAVNNAAKFMADSGVGADGALTGEGSGFGGPITVEVTMDGDDITSVTIVSNSETPSIAGDALEQIPAAIVEADTADVDIVAGATYTSNGIINAVKDALSKAGGGGTDGALTGTADGFIGPITVEVTMDGDTITSVTVVDNSETLNIASGALEQIPEAIVAANSPDVDVVAGATYTSNGIMNAVKDAIGAAE